MQDAEPVFHGVAVPCLGICHAAMTGIWHAGPFRGLDLCFEGWICACMWQALAEHRSARSWLLLSRMQCCSALAVAISRGSCTWCIVYGAN
eukprot:365661-Chlamydomonas_euryale.AAC.65